MSLFGCLLPTAPWTGRIVGIFDEVISIIHPDGAIVSVVADEDRMEARAFCHSEGFQTFAHAVSAHAVSANIDLRDDDRPVLIFREGILTLQPRDAAPDSGIVSLDFSGASIWDPRISVAAFDHARIPCIAGQIKRILDSEHRKGRLYEGIHSPKEFSTEVFARAFTRLKELKDFPVNLVGFGPGTTPAGDDWLTGYLAALDLRGPKTETAARKLREGIADSLSRTTPAGKSLLLGALACVPPAYLVALSRASSNPENYPAALESAVTAALRHGATSGEDALAGFLEGLQANIQDVSRKVAKDAKDAKAM